MKQPPKPLTWPQVVSLETARRESEQATRALDRVFQQNDADALKAALDEAEWAATQEYHAWVAAPRWN